MPPPPLFLKVGLDVPEKMLKRPTSDVKKLLYFKNVDFCIRLSLFKMILLSHSGSGPTLPARHCIPVCAICHSAMDGRIQWRLHPDVFCDASRGWTNVAI